MQTRRQSLQKISFNENVNLGLWLDKFIGNQDDTENSIKEFNSTLLTARREQKKMIVISADYEKFFNRRTDSLRQIEPNLFKTIKIDSRMVIGLGGESVWENSLSIHHTYGVPFIPGSALKGLAASYARKFLQNFDKDGTAYKFIFGSQESAGYIVFHDALLLPESTKSDFIHPDVMTVHHPNYYGNGKEAPADWDSPTPINFLSASGKYQLVLTGVEGGEQWLKIVAEILEKAFKDEGIGAKTSSGYGRATFIETPEEIAARKEREKEQQRFQMEWEEKQQRLKEEQVRREKEAAHAEYLRLKEAEKQAEEERRQKSLGEKFKKIKLEIESITPRTKKPEKMFEKIVENLEKNFKPEQQAEIAKTALAKIQNLQAENVKINTSRKWFEKLKKIERGG